MSLSITNYYNYMNALSSLTGQVTGTSQAFGGLSDITESGTNSSDFCFEAALTSMINQSKEAYDIIAEKKEGETAGLSAQKAGQTTWENFQNALGSLGGSRSTLLYQMLSTLSENSRNTLLSALGEQTVSYGDDASVATSLSQIQEAYQQLAASSNLPLSSEETLFAMLNNNSSNTAEDTTSFLKQQIPLSSFFAGIANML